MKCPICASLNREHHRECEIEASASLRQRSLTAWLAPVPSSRTDQDYAEIVLASRKRQMAIASSLERHQSTDHAA